MPARAARRDSARTARLLRAELWSALADHRPANRVSNNPTKNNHNPPQKKRKKGLTGWCDARKMDSCARKIHVESAQEQVERKTCKAFA